MLEKLGLSPPLFEPEDFGEEFGSRDARKAKDSKVCGEFSLPRCLSCENSLGEFPGLSVDGFFLFSLLFVGVLKELSFSAKLPKFLGLSKFRCLSWLDSILESVVGALFDKSIIGL